MLKVVRATDIIHVQHPIFLIVGMPGIGKSSIMYSADRVVALNFDSESAQSRAVNRGDSLNILDVEALEEVERNGHPLIDAAETVSIDTVGCCIEVMTAAVIKDNPKFRQSSGSLTQQGWGELKKRFTRFIGQFRSQKNLLLITHAKEKEQDAITFYRPTIDGGARDYVIQQADFVAFLHMVGKERVLDFNPTEMWHGKNPGQWPALVVPAPEKCRTFMAQLFQKGRDALGKISEASASIANQVEDWRADIQTYATADEFNRAAPKVRELPPMLYAQVARILVDAAAAKGIPFDKISKKFLQPEMQLTGAIL